MERHLIEVQRDGKTWIVPRIRLHEDFKGDGTWTISDELGKLPTVTRGSKVEAFHVHAEYRRLTEDKGLSFGTQWEEKGN